MAKNLITDAIAHLWLGYRTGDDENASSCLYVDSNETITAPMLIDRANIPTKKKGYLRFVVVSDTHTRHQCLGILPQGDIFVHSGDILMSSRLWTSRSRYQQYVEFNEWLGSEAVNCKTKIIIGGNHDAELDAMEFEECVKLFCNATYLENSATIIPSDNPQCRDVFLYGTPCSTGRSGNRAFQSHKCHHEAFHNVKKEVDAYFSANQQLIPVFISHGHNRSIRDELCRYVDVKAHLWGHAHGHYGVEQCGVNKLVSVCSSVMDHRYCPTNPPVVLDLFVGRSTYATT